MKMKTKKGMTQIMGLIGAVIVILVAITVLPTIADTVGTAKANTNVTSASQSMLDIAVLLFVVGIMVAGIGWAVGKKTGRI